MSTDALEPQTCRIALLAGGKSGEREISLASGRGAEEALRAAGFPVVMLDPSSCDDMKRLIDEHFDVAFICLHGVLGEDGAIQGFLELLDIPYIGSGVWSSATAMDKAKSKAVYEQAGLPTPRFLILKRPDSCDISMLDLETIVNTVGEHCVVKVPTEGSSLGLYMVERVEELPGALSRAFSACDHVVVEQFVEGIECTVVVLGNDDARALPVIQILPANEFYDFEAKYAPGGSKHVCPAPFDEATTETLQSLAVNAHASLECSGVSRTDFIVDKAGACWLLETNTIPGMTATSLLPDAAQAAGMSFSEVCTELVRLALERHERRLPISRA